ncbi:hypothetical protein J2Z21_006783 [Streptomyces griseochromogenes]|uniref:wHTH-Hsp90 Na associated domain-containing protein n=1 Tax=Streptomyces griseochromogenes TaxID=68214 RepID=A0ABS4M2C2_9ACTN|nr:hypothetical protein [Streptomyces griseochromogenes]MBP2053788.1 hypothetical protein [Streptomyces griseochromogenes]
MPSTASPPRGPVGAAHIRFAAHAVDADEEWVRERLALYAEFFRLEPSGTVTTVPAATGRPAAGP